MAKEKQEIKQKTNAVRQKKFIKSPLVEEKISKRRPTSLTPKEKETLNNMLIAALNDDSITKAEILLKFGADINCQDSGNFNHTPLMNKVSDMVNQWGISNPTVVRFMLSNGANPLITTSHKQRASDFVPAGERSRKYKGLFQLLKLYEKCWEAWDSKIPKVLRAVRSCSPDYVYRKFVNM